MTAILDALTEVRAEELLKEGDVVGARGSSLALTSASRGGTFLYSLTCINFFSDRHSISSLGVQKKGNGGNLPLKPRWGKFFISPIWGGGKPQRWL